MLAVVEPHDDALDEPMPESSAEWAYGQVKRTDVVDDVLGKAGLEPADAVKALRRIVELAGVRRAV